MSQWESQLRTNLEDPVYGGLLDHALTTAPGLMAAGIVNVRYAEGCLRLPDGQLAPEAELEQLIFLTQGLFPSVVQAELPSGYAAALAKLRPVESMYWTTKSERLFASSLPGGRVVVLCMPASLRLGAALILVGDASKNLRGDTGRDLGELFQGVPDVTAAGMLDPRTESFGELHVRPDRRSDFAFDERTAVVLSQFFGNNAKATPVVFQKTTDERLEVLSAQLSGSGYVRNFWAMPFDPEHVMFALAGQAMLPGLISTVAKRATEDTVRVWAEGLLAWGIDAILEPFPETQREFLEIVEELRRLHENDLIQRLRIGGFANYTMGEGENVQRCQECIYYHPHRKWCDLPELPIPVEPHWWCRLWKL